MPKLGEFCCNKIEIREYVLVACCRELVDTCTLCDALMSSSCCWLLQLLHGRSLGFYFRVGADFHFWRPCEFIFLILTSKMRPSAPFYPRGTQSKP
jgi:hypothetical protein